jgi:HD superfamily phosphohydrolase
MPSSIKQRPDERLKEHIVRDPIHGFVHLDRFDFIKNIVSTPEFQRLRYVSQLGVSSVVYPSATHNRFSHSLGAMHVMEEMLDHLRRVGDVKNEIFDDLLRTGSATALLHDIGHGPLSHASEKFFGFNHESMTAKIITRPPISDILNAGDVEPERIVRILRHIASGPDVLLSQLISSELDVDRLDYLTRDSYFTGVGFGNIDLERIIAMLRKFRGNGALQNHAITLFKGRHSIESYILGRHLMYQAVYFHKATRGAEKLVGSAFRRATEAKSRAPVPDSLEFLESEVVPSLDDVLQMDDHTVFDSIRRWQRSKDRKLSDICKRFCQRNLLKAIELTPKKLNAYVSGVDKKFERLARRNGIDPEYLCPIDGPSETPYTVYSIKPPEDITTVTTSIFLYDEEGKTAEVSRVSDVVEALAKKEYYNRLYTVDKIREEAIRLFTA